MARHIWTVKRGALEVYSGPRLVDAMTAYGDVKDPNNNARLYRDGRRLHLSEDNDQPELEVE